MVFEFQLAVYNIVEFYNTVRYANKIIEEAEIFKRENPPCVKVFDLPPHTLAYVEERAKEEMKFSSINTFNDFFRKG